MHGDPDATGARHRGYDACGEGGVMLARPMERSEVDVMSTAYVPLSRLAICLNCDACFGIGPERCPACGSETWSLLGRFIQPLHRW
jgi:hypothetical protein